ncbi:MAG: MFS transporter, partial [Thermoplasmata archaeon]
MDLKSSFIFQNKKFLRFWIAQFFIRLNVWVFYVYFIWVITVKNHSVFLGGMIPTFSLLGYLAILIPEGYILDRWNRSTIMFLSSIMLIVLYGSLFFNQTLLWIYVIDILSSMLASITFDAFFTISKEIVDEKYFPKVSAFSQISMNISGIFGILIGGLSILTSQFIFFYILIIVSIIGSIFNLPYVSAKTKYEKYRYTDILKFLKKFVFLLIILFIVNGLFISLDVYSSGLIYFILHSTSIYYTLFLGGYPVGGLLGAIFGNKIANKLEDPWKISILIALMGMMIIGISQSRTVLLDPIFTFILGFLISLLMIPLMAFMMRVIPNEMIGRVNAFITL